MTDLRRSEKRGRCVGTSGHARAAADARRSVHRVVYAFFGNQNGIRILGTTGRSADESSGLNDPVEGGAIDCQILDHWKRASTPGLDVDRIAVLEAAHMELAGCGSFYGTMCHAVDHQPARAAYPLSAIMIECNRYSAVIGESLVHDVEHLEK